MSSIPRARIRIRADESKSEIVADSYTGETPDFWRGEDIQFEIGVFYGKSLVDIGNIDQIVLQVKELASKTGSAVMEKIVAYTDLNRTMTLDQWNAKTHQHAEIAFTNAETNLTLGSDSKEYWIVIGAITTDTPGRRITLAAGKLKISEDGWTGEGSAPTPGDPDYYTTTESDARYWQLSGEVGPLQFTRILNPSGMTAAYNNQTGTLDGTAQDYFIAWETANGYSEAIQFTSDVAAKTSMDITIPAPPTGVTFFHLWWNDAVDDAIYLGKFLTSNVDIQHDGGTTVSPTPQSTSAPDYPQWNTTSGQISFDDGNELVQFRKKESTGEEELHHTVATSFRNVEGDDDAGPWSMKLTNENAEGRFTIKGQNGDGNLFYNGVDVILLSGNAFPNGSGGDGGNLELVAGQGTGSGKTGGDVEIVGGFSSSSADGGDVWLREGTGAGTNGLIWLGQDKNARMKDGEFQIKLAADGLFYGLEIVDMGGGTRMVTCKQTGES